MQQDASPQTNSAATNSSLTSGNNHVTVPVSVAINDVYTVLAVIQVIIDSVCDQNYDHSHKGRVYMPTFKYFFLAFLIVAGNNHQPGSIFKDVFKVYKRICAFNNVQPLQLRSIEIVTPTATATASEGVALWLFQALAWNDHALITHLSNLVAQGAWADT